MKTELKTVRIIDLDEYDVKEAIKFWLEKGPHKITEGNTILHGFVFSDEFTIDHISNKPKDFKDSSYAGAKVRIYFNNRI